LEEIEIEDAEFKLNQNEEKKVEQNKYHSLLQVKFDIEETLNKLSTDIEKAQKHYKALQETLMKNHVEIKNHPLNPSNMKEKV